MYLVTAAQMRELDRLTIEDYGTPGHVLMERAGAGATEALLASFPQVQERRTTREQSSPPVVVIAGKGNNGGDGFVMARLLKKKGIGCEVVLTAKRADVKGDARRNLLAFVRMRGRVSEVTQLDQLAAVQKKLTQASLIVDALLGTGLNAPVRGLPAALIELMNTSGVPILAVDVPSGLDADRGIPLGTAVQAAVTTSFAYPKVGQAIYPGVQLGGRLMVIDIGIAAEAVATVDPHIQLLNKEMIGALIQPRQPETHKGSFGHLFVLAGARGKSGAALLAASAALRTGTGLVTLGGPQSLLPIFASTLLEAMTVPLPERPDGSLRLAPQALRHVLQDRTAITFGPGIGVSADTIKLTRWLLKYTDKPLLIDADGLNCVATDPNMLRDASSSTSPISPASAIVLTPHPGEMARLTKTSIVEVQANRLEMALTFAMQYDCYVVLKGARTVIAAPDGWTWINPTGNPGMASGGMGDVLAGVIGGLLAQGYPPREACQLGVFLHGTAGDLAAQEVGEIGMLARDVIERLPSGLRILCQAAPSTESMSTCTRV